MRIVLTLLALIILAQPCWGINRTYYVKTNGSDSKDGRSWANAWKTIDKVNNTIVAGDTVRFGSGIWYNSQIRPPQGGNATHVTVYACSTFDARSKHDPKIFGGEKLTTWSPYSGSIYRKYWSGSGCYESGCGALAQNEEPLQLIDPGYTSLSEGRYYFSGNYIYVWCYGSADPNTQQMIASCKPPVYMNSHNPDIAYVRFWGLDLRYGQQGTVYFNARTNHVSVEHCKIGSAGHTSANGAGVFASANDGGKVATDSSTFGHYNMVRACEIGNLRTVLCSWSRLGTSDGIVLYSEKYFTMDSNYFYPPIATGINIKGKGVGTTMEGHVAKFNTFYNTERQAIDVWVHPYRDSLYGNVIINPGTHGIFIHTSSLPWAGDIVVFNNTIYNAPDRGIEIWEDNPIGHCGEGIEIKYNVIHSAFEGVAFSYWNSPTCQNACDINYNMYYNIDRGNECSSGISWSAWRSCGFDLNGTYGTNPGFADAGSSDFSRPGASSEMARTDYGDRYWTVWGAIQPNVDCDEPGTPALVSPANGAWDVGWPVVFDWSDVGGALNYQIQITISDFLNPHLDVQPSQSGYSTSSLYPETSYLWRVRAKNICGWGSWSSVRSFTTSGISVKAEGFSTECEGSYPTSHPTLVVNNASRDADNSYSFEVAADSLFTEIVAATSAIVQKDGETTSWKVDEQLDSGRDYYWRASANLGDHTEPCVFRVYPTPHMYPSPFNPFETPNAVFTEVPEGATLVIVTVEEPPRRVRAWENTTGEDIIWDGTNDQGEMVASGVYMWYVEETDIQGKFAVIR